MTAAPTQIGKHRTIQEKSAVKRAAGGAVAGAALTAGLVGTFGVGTATAAPGDQIPGQIATLVGNGITFPTGLPTLVGALPLPTEVAPIAGLLPGTFTFSPGGISNAIAAGNNLFGASLYFLPPAALTGGFIGTGGSLIGNADPLALTGDGANGGLLIGNGGNSLTGKGGNGGLLFGNGGLGLTGGGNAGAIGNGGTGILGPGGDAGFVGNGGSSLLAADLGILGATDGTGGKGGALIGNGGNGAFGILGLAATAALPDSSVTAAMAATRPPARVATAVTAAHSQETAARVAPAVPRSISLAL